MRRPSPSFDPSASRRSRCSSSRRWASAAPTPPPATAFVRLNQVGYPSNLPKRAFLMASAAETGATFES